MKLKNTERSNSMNNSIDLRQESQANQLSSRSLDEAQVPSYPEGAMVLAEEPTLISLESLVKEEPAKSFNTLRESIEEIDPNNIQPVTSIPDYVEPTSCTNPIVVKTSSSIYCIEGWSLVQQALEAEQPMLTCHIYHVAEVSEEELAIRKVAVRVVPHGGVDTYGERIRNVRILFNMLSQNLENPLVYAHGGVRKGIGFTSNREDNVRQVLAERLRKSVTTISKYLNHAEHLSDEALNDLAEARAGKDFFEKVQVVKRTRVRDLISSSIAEDDIVTQVSQEMVRMHQEPQEIENLRASLIQNTQDDDSEGQAQEDEPAQASPPQPQPFDYWQGNGPPKEDQPANEDEVRREGVAIAERMIASFRNPSLSPDELKQAVKVEIQNLLALIQKFELDGEEDLLLDEAV
jgi:hypothetical protein